MTWVTSSIIAEGLAVMVNELEQLIYWYFYVLCDSWLLIFVKIVRFLELSHNLIKTVEGNMEGYRETEMCSRCRGRCCSLQPGHCLPPDFGSAEAVKEALVSGRYTIVLLLDWNIMARVVRPHYKDPQRKVGCIFQQENGCELPWPARPYGCRMLRPRERDGEHCKPEGISIEEAARMWERSGYLPPIWSCLHQIPLNE